MNKNLVYSLFLIIFLEGYAVLSSELIAIRIITPLTSNTTDIVAIIISAVLFPLSLGYYYGSNFKPHRGKNEFITYRKKLLKNFLNSLISLSFVVSFLFVTTVFGLFQVGFNLSSIATASLYGVLICYPTFLLGQTISLISNYFRKFNVSEINGRILFFSTIGSLCGSLFTTLVIMPTLGVHYAAIISIFSILWMIFIISRKLLSYEVFLATMFFALVIFVNSESVMKANGVIENNQYHTIKIDEYYDKDSDETLKVFNSNGAGYSAIKVDGEGNIIGSIGYFDYINNNFIKHMAEGDEVYDILVLGAGAFVVGLEDQKNNYVYVDIDSTLKTLSEDHFIKQKIKGNKEFVVDGARSFLNKNKQKFDFVLIDVFNGENIPQQLLTLEFFADIKRLMKEKASLAVNFAQDQYFNNKFTRKFDNTFRHIFKHYYVVPVGEFNHLKEDAFINNVYIYKNRPDSDADYEGLYNDLKSEYFPDK